MTESKFNLSEKIQSGIYGNYGDENDNLILTPKDVKEFIRLLKEEFNRAQGEYDDSNEIIDALAGDALK